ncbi:MAG TPA: FixH family protein [Pyrinomonadaceae bacterium]
MKKSFVLIGIAVIGVVLIAAACGSKTGTNSSISTGKVIKSAPVGNLKVTLSNDDGVLKHGNEEFMVAFTDASGKPVDVGAVSLNFHMAQMGGMQEMNDATAFTTTSIAGVYRGKADIEVAGEWQAQIAYEGPAGKGKTSFPVNAQ